MCRSQDSWARGLAIGDSLEKYPAVIEAAHSSCHILFIGWAHDLDLAPCGDLCLHC